MPDQFEICLLGSLRIHRSNQPIANPTSEKIRGLLAWLAAESDRPHRRDLLAELIWHDQPDGKAAQNLRQALSRLQRTIAPNGESLPWLEIGRQTVLVRNGGELWIDLHRFTHLLNETAHHRHERIEQCQSCCEKLTRAVELYRGDFLLGLSPNSPAFDEWALLKREWLRREVLQAFGTLVHFHEAKGDPAAAYRFAWRRVEIDPLLEDAHQQVMRTLAASGRRNEALAQYETLTRLLYDELGVEPARETTALYEAICDDKMTRWQDDKMTLGHPAILPSRHPVTNLPPQHTPFIGRKVELAQITERLAHPNCHLLTLVGLGGVGKTRLAIEAARGQVEHFADGIHFVNLALLNNCDLLPVTIANALGIELGDDAETYAKQRSVLLAKLNSHKLLLLLDNAEHLLAASSADPLLDLIVEILQSAPQIKLLVTSRQPLGLRAEWIFDVEGLGLPEVGEEEMGRWGDEAEEQRPLPLSPYLPINSDAVQLFIHAAQRILPGFVAESELASLIEICQRTEGLALGIELAAAWVRQFSCTEIARRIQNSYDFLATNMRDVPERHRSLRAIFESSWALLDEADRAIYQQLALFRGTFDLVAATRIATATADDLRRLTERSLVRVDGSSATGERYSLHEALRQFAAEKLAEDVRSFTQSQQRHAHYYLHLLKKEEAALSGDEIHEALLRVQNEIGNIRTAWQTAVEQSDVGNLARTYYAFMRYFVLTHQVEEGIKELGAVAECIHLYLDALSQPDGQLTESLAEIIAYRGRLFYKLAHYDEAIAHCTETLKLAEPIGAERPAALANLYWGISLVSLGNLEAARTKFVQSQLHAQRAGWRKVEGDAIRGLGIVHEYTKDFAQATVFYEASAEICRQINDVRGLSASIGNLGSICRQEGDFERARQLLEEALVIHRQIGDRSSEGRSLSNLGELNADLEEYERAEQYFNAALAVQRAIKEPQHEADTLTSLGELYARTGKTKHAIPMWEEALMVYERIGETPNRERVLAYLRAYRTDQD